MRPIVALTLLACVSVACGDDDADSADAASLPDAADPIDAAGSADAACPQAWTVSMRDASASASIGNGALTLSDTDTPQGSAVEVVRAGITGDFDLTFTFSGWTAAGSGAFFQAGIGEDVTVQTRFVVAGIGTFPIVGVGAAEQPDDGDPAANLQATVAAAGSVRYRRSGSTLIATAMTADATAEITLTDFSEDPLKTGVQIGSNNGTLSGVTSVDITGFTITGGGATVTDDTFDCDSLIAP